MATLACWPREASAQFKRTPIFNNHYAVEFYQGPLLAPINVEGLGGATTAVDGSSINAAAPGVREPFSVKWFDTDVELGISFPGAFSQMDYDNHGPSSSDQVNDFLYADFGLRLQFGELGVAATGELLRYSVVGRGGLDVTAGRYHLLAAYGFDDNQLVFGGGFRAVTLQLSQGSGFTHGINPIGASLTMTGFAPEGGMIFKPNDYPFRVGVTLRAPVNGTNLGVGNTTTDSSGVVRSAGFIIPNTITMPWELEAGFALQLGPRPLNPAWIDPHDEDAPVKRAILSARERRAVETIHALEETVPEHRAARQAELARQEAAIREIEEQHLALEEAQLLAERRARYANWPREKILVVASVLLTGASSNAIALEDFFQQQFEAYGNHLTASPRVGVEAEPIPNYLKGRIGSYFEPSRFDGIAARQHFTSGFDVKLFRWDGFGVTKGQVWRVSGAVDFAPRYTDWGISFGAWH